VVFEIKREKNGLTRKRRVWLERPALASALSREFLPVLAVSYERHVFQRHQAWRVTLDREVRFHPVAPQVALSPEPVDRARLEPEIDRETRVVIEVKHLGEVLPEWLRALHRASSPRYSKFAEGMRRLHARVLEVGG
jgi:hypothetical protein